MRSYLFILLFVSSLQGFACDMCGCSNGGSFFGILPQSHLRFVGLRYRQVSFDSHLTSQLLRTQETFQTAELWGRFYPFKKTQFMFFVPFSVNSQTMVQSGDKASIKGVGDITLLGHYNILNTFWDSTAHAITHSIMLGGGLKLPTGKYQFDAQSVAEVANANFQLGTGSVDFMANVIHTIRYKDWGLNTNLTYKMNTSNKNQYRFGNRFTATSSVFRTITIGELTLLPNAGLYYEHSAQNQQNNQPNSLTGGDLLAVSTGIEGYFKQFSVGINGQMPVAQNLVSKEIKQNTQVAFHVTVMF